MLTPGSCRHAKTQGEFFFHERAMPRPWACMELDMPQGLGKAGWGLNFGADRAVHTWQGLAGYEGFKRTPPSVLCRGAIETVCTPERSAGPGVQSKWWEATMWQANPLSPLPTNTTSQSCRPSQGTLGWAAWGC